MSKVYALSLKHVSDNGVTAVSVIISYILCVFIRYNLTDANYTDDLLIV